MNELNIRQKRISWGWTQTHVGQKVGISKQAIHDIETGKQKPSYDVLLKLLALFNVEHKNIIQLFAPVETIHPKHPNFTTEEAVETNKKSSPRNGTNEAKARSRKIKVEGKCRWQKNENADSTQENGKITKKL